MQYFLSQEDVRPDCRTRATMRDETIRSSPSGFCDNVCTRVLLQMNLLKCWENYFISWRSLYRFIFQKFFVKTKKRQQILLKFAENFQFTIRYYYSKMITFKQSSFLKSKILGILVSRIHVRICFGQTRYSLPEIFFSYAPFYICVRSVMYGQFMEKHANFRKTWIWRTASPAAPVLFAGLGQAVTRWHFGAVYALRASWMHFLLRHYALVLFVVRFSAIRKT